MNHINRFIIVLLVLIPLFPAWGFAGEEGIFRSVPSSIPRPGVLRVANDAFYSKTQVNDVLKNQYGVKEPRLLSNITNLELGVTRNIALIGSVPYYADLFTQKKRGYKSGAGDVTAGVRYFMNFPEGPLDHLSIGSRVLIPERFGYGREPLGFRTFSMGEFGYCLESGARARSKLGNLYFSAAAYRYHNESELPGNKAEKAPAGEFFDTGFGYRGIGKGDSTGFAPTILRNQFSLSAGGIIPFHRYLAGIVEFQTVYFTGKERIDPIMRLTPGIRLGTAEGFSFSIGMDIGLSGPIPKSGVVMQLSIPSISPRDISEGLGIRKKAQKDERIHSRNTLVAIPEFTRQDDSFPYEQEMRAAFQDALGSMELMNVVPREEVDRAIHQEALNPVKDSPNELGVRLGAQYIITAQVRSYTAIRSSRFTIPYIVMMPKTDFTLSAKTFVTNLATGKVYDLGMVTAVLAKPRGTVFFSTGKSDDIEYFSEPETLQYEKELIDRWVDTLNTRLLERMDLFDWKPKKSGNTDEGVTKG